MQDFEPFYLKDGMLWVPYFSGGERHLHFLKPDVAMKAVGYALQVLGDGGKVIPFALSGFRRKKVSGAG